jgi:hypothetical protein
MDKDEFSALMRVVFEQAPAGGGEFMGGFGFVTQDGVLAIPGDASGVVGFGIAAELTPTPLLLAGINDANRLMTFGHYWLAEGSDNDHWVLVCGFKFPYSTSSRDDVGQVVAGVTRSHGAIAAAVLEKIGDTPHRRYWLADTDADTQGFVLMTHLA